MFRAEKKLIKIIICCFFIGSNYFYCQNQKKIDSLKIALKNAKHDTTRAIINLDLGELIYQQQPDSAILLWEKSKTISEKNLKKYSPKQQEYKTFLNILGYSYNDLGFIFGNRGDVVKSLEYHKKSLKIQEEIGDKNAIALSYNNIGLIYGGQSDYDNALIFFEKSLKIREEIGNKSGIAVSLNSIGNMHARQGSMEKALSYFNRSLKICQEINDNSGIAESLSNIGNMYNNFGDRQKALDIFIKCLEIFEKLKDKESIASMLNSIAPVDNKKRKKFGIIDYLATHHYYLWSPLEKTVIIPMAVLGLTYTTFMSYIWPLLLITFLYISYYILSLNDDEVDIEVKDDPINWKNIILVVVPFLTTILVSCFTPFYFAAFTTFTFYLIMYSKSWSKLFNYINWELIWIVALVIILGNIIGSYSNEIENYIKLYNNPKNILFICVISFLASFLLGSSAKYASIVSLLTSVFGMEYFVLFFTLEYSAYLISPSHKCLPIGQKYFHTGFLTYLKALIIWISIMIMYAVTTIL